MRPGARLVLGFSATVGAAYALGVATRGSLGDRYEQMPGIRRDLSGLAHRLAGRAKRFSPIRQNGDAVLARRVRSALETVVSNPRMLAVSAHEGAVTLHGDILVTEHAVALQAVRALRGVRDVTDFLSDRSGKDAAAFMRGGSPKSRGFDLTQAHWPPAARIFGGLTAGVLLLRAVSHRGVLDRLAAAAGASLLLRSTTNIPLSRLSGVKALGKRLRVIDIRRTVIVQAPLEHTFSVLEAFENFPVFMRHIRAVLRPSDRESVAGPSSDGASRWVVAGPAGVAIESDAVTTVNRRNKVLAWRSVPNAGIEHAGIIRIDTLPVDSTRIDLQMSYCPPAGALGHAMGRVFGRDAETVLDEDLKRLKCFIELTKPTSPLTSANSATAGSASRLR